MTIPRETTTTATRARVHKEERRRTKTKRSASVSVARMDDATQRQSENKREDGFGGMEGSERMARSILPQASSALPCFPRAEGQKGPEDMAPGTNPTQHKCPSLCIS